MKRGLCLLLAALMAFNIGAVNVSAAEMRERKADRGRWSEEDYDHINHALNYIGYDEEDTVYYTDLKITRNEEDNMKYVSFVYDDERAIGQYIKEECGEEVKSCFIINKESELLNNLVRCYEGSEFAINNEEMYIEAAATDGAKDRGWQTIGKGSAEYVTGFADTGKFLAPKIVENTERFTSEKIYGLCWAACGASIANYYRGTSYDTWSVYNQVLKTTGLEQLLGSPATIKCMLSTLGLHYNELERRLTYTQALSALEDNSLIMYSLQGAEGGHGVVLCGVFRINSYYGFIYMDPNVTGGYVLNYNDKSAATATSGNFYYFNGAYQSTWVSHTFYNFEKLYYIK